MLFLHTYVAGDACVGLPKRPCASVCFLGDGRVSAGRGKGRERR